MRRIGVILLVLGLVGFIVASSQRGKYETVEGRIKTTFSSEERGKEEAWESGRWVALGVGVIGLVLVVLPGRKT